MSPTTVNRIAIAVLVLLELGGVISLFRILISDPAPGIFAGSLRRAATRMLRPAAGGARVRHRLLRALAVLWRWRGFLVVGLAAGVLALPVTVRWGPLSSSKESVSYLQALWVVVAASLGLSVALVAFAFQAFVTGAREVHGGTLREFADETLLLDAIGLGVLTLLLIGAVLLNVGHESPHGWSAACATLFSAITLLGVLYVVNRVVRSLDERELLDMRSRRLRRTVQLAMFEQLIRQTAESILEHTRMPISRGLVREANSVEVSAHTNGEVRDVKLGTLARAMMRTGSTAQLTVSLGASVELGEPLIWLLGENPQPSRAIRRAVKIGRAPRQKPPEALLEQLGQLHRQAAHAAREGLQERWRQIADCYEEVLLALPPAAGSYGLAFAGAIASPGLFGVGPLHRIQRYIFDEARTAVDADNSELIDEILAFPARVARRAVRIGAPTIASTMLALYPALYQLAQERSK